MNEVPTLSLESEETVGMERSGRIGGVKRGKPLVPCSLSTVLWDRYVEQALAFR